MVHNCESIVLKISTLQEESFTWKLNVAILLFTNGKFAKSEFRLSYLDVYKSFNDSLHNWKSNFKGR